MQVYKNSTASYADDTVIKNKTELTKICFVNKAKKLFRCSGSGRALGGYHGN